SYWNFSATSDAVFQERFWRLQVGTLRHYVIKLGGLFVFSNNTTVEIANRKIAQNKIPSIPPMFDDAVGEAIRNGMTARNISARTRENTAATLPSTVRFL
ncbi:MAG: hypothetical protein NZ903_02940, partial [Candidatus Micrarchaeota archaeon]|nr:hypothetical protein [Candidatus Micrarchaeota archaeon]